jgi:hypothetical protein
MPINTDEMLEKVKDRQWALADIDWDAPGAELITDEQRVALKQFMTDIVWAEQSAACGFKALELKVTDPALKEIYRMFQAEEQRHANAELALMHRWGMLGEGDEVPEPNINMRLVMDWMDRNVDKMSLPILGTFIPVAEVMLDGALVKFLLDEVADPVCHQTFAKINADESRHLAVDFHLLELLGAPRMRRLVINTVTTMVRPSMLIGLLKFGPLLSRVRDNIIEMGLEEEKLYRAIKRFSEIGDRSPTTPRNPVYRLARGYASMVIDRHHPFHRFIGDPLVRMSDHYPRRLLREKPSWVRTLTYEPLA